MRLSRSSTLVVVASLCGLALACADKQAEEQRLKESRQRERVLALAARHNTVSGWHEALVDGRVPLFTVTLENALMKTDGRPVLLAESMLEDISLRDGHYYVELSATELYMGEVRFLLECPSEIATALLARKDLMAFDRFAVVARIESVRKVFGLRPERDGEDVRIASGTLFVVLGKCLEVLPLE